jgi:branched-chain amino acid transport system permease protein
VSGSRSSRMVVDYGDDLRLFPSALSKLGVLALVVAWLILPLNVNDTGGYLSLNVLCYAGIAAVGAIGLNLLVGYTGQVSLGHGFFIAAGGYTVAYLGGERGWPLAVWLPLAGLIGFVLGAAIGPFALRLRGHYLVIVTLGVLFVGQYVFNNWESVTGGGGGASTVGALRTLDGKTFTIFGQVHSREEGYFWLIWAIVGVSALLARNLVRSRAGRAMQAIRDRDLAAEVIGVSAARYKVSAFAWSSAFAGVAGALFGAFQRSFNWVDPPSAMLTLSIQYIAIIILGGLGTISGAILGALLVGSLPYVIQQASLEHDLPLVSGRDPVLSVASLNNIIYGVLIIGFLLLEPRGLTAVWFRVKTWFKTWPFSR